MVRTEHAPLGPADPRLLLAHADVVRRIARAVARDPDVAADAEQDAWVAALSSRPGPAPARARAWLATVARNAARRALRGEARRRRRERAVARPEAAPAPDAASDRVALAVGRAILALDDLTRRAIWHRFYDGWPPRVVAARLGLTVDAVRARIRRGLATVRTRWAGERRSLLGGGGLVGAGVAGEGLGPVEGVVVMASSKTWVGAVAAAVLAAGTVGIVAVAPGAAPGRAPVVVADAGTGADASDGADAGGSRGAVGPLVADGDRGGSATAGGDARPDTGFLARSPGGRAAVPPHADADRADLGRLERLPVVHGAYEGVERRLFVGKWLERLTPYRSRPRSPEEARRDLDAARVAAGAFEGTPRDVASRTMGVQAAAVALAAAEGSGASAAAVIADLGSSDEGTALVAIGRARALSPPPVDALARLALQGPTAVARAAALVELAGTHGADPRAAETVVALLEDPDPIVLSTAYAMLVYVRPRGALVAIERASRPAAPAAVVDFAAQAIRASPDAASLLDRVESAPLLVALRTAHPGAEDAEGRRAFGEAAARALDARDVRGDDVVALLGVLEVEDFQAATRLEGAVARRQQRGDAWVAAAASTAARLAEAAHGDPPIVQSASYDAGDQTLDATDAVRRLVEAGARTVLASNGLVGDPAPGIPKTLRVEYRRGGERRVATAAEGGRAVLR